MDGQFKQVLVDNYHPIDKYGFFLEETGHNFKKRKCKSSAKQRIKIRKMLHEKQGGLCKYCGKELALEQTTIDHIVPRSKGGDNSRTNLVGACRRCNEAKGNSIIDTSKGFIIQCQPLKQKE